MFYRGFFYLIQVGPIESDLDLTSVDWLVTLDTTEPWVSHFPIIVLYILKPLPRYSVAFKVEHQLFF